MIKRLLASLAILSTLAFAQLPVKIVDGNSVEVGVPGTNATVIAGQQAVTGSAVTLATNTIKTVCVKALGANTINVYLGGTGVTTATGMELAANQSWCGNLTNTNKIFVIASTTGASVSWIATN